MIDLAPLVSHHELACAYALSCILLLLIIFLTLQTLPHELTSDEHLVIATELQRLEASASGEQGIRVFELSLPGRPPLFIKRGDNDPYAEASTQMFFHALAKNDGSTPRIPRVFDVFNTEEGNYFLVMEKVEAKTLDCCGIPEEEAVQLAAFAVKWLSTLR